MYIKHTDNSTTFRAMFVLYIYIFFFSEEVNRRKEFDANQTKESEKGFFYSEMLYLIPQHLEN